MSRLRYLQEAADASSGDIGGRMSLKEISTAVTLHHVAAVLLSEMVRSAISEQNYRELKLAGVGKTLKNRGRKPGSSTTTADSTPRKRRRRQTSEPPVTA